MNVPARRPLRIVLTGGPGAGKTTLLNALAARGWVTVPEAARAVIRERKAMGLAPRPDPARFAAEIVRRDIEQYQTASGERVAFDRSLLDALGMLDEAGALNHLERDRQVAAYPYFNPVFVLPPWAAIYRQDEERDQTFDHAVAVCGRLCAWYRTCGYDLVTVPEGTVEERCTCVLATIASVAP